MDRTSGLGFVVDANGHRVFADPDLVAGVDGTDVEQVWLTDLQEELIGGLIEYAGLTPTAGNRTQVRQALQKLFDSTIGYASTNNGIVNLPGGVILQKGAAIVPSSGGLITTLVTLPVAFPNNCVDAQICLLGSSPPPNAGSVCVQRISRSQVAVTTYYPTGTNQSLGVCISTTGL